MPKVMWAPMGKLVPQLPGVVTFAYDLRFRCVIALLERYFRELHIMSSNSDYVYSLTVASKKNIV
jgi:hypothetical protein